MNLIDLLRGEHALLYRLADHLDEQSALYTDISQIRRLAELLHSLINSHSAVEEAILDPALSPFLSDHGPLQAMKAEHDEIRAKLEALHRTTQWDLAGSLLHSVLDLLRVHLKKEEDTLFPITSQLLDADTLAGLGHEYAVFRGLIDES